MPALNELYSFNKDVGLGVIFAHGDLWQDQRRFMAKTLKEMTVAVGGYKPFSEQISDEYYLFEEYLRRKCQIVSWLLKGQLISKAIYGVLDSPKKRTKKI